MHTFSHQHKEVVTLADILFNFVNHWRVRPSTRAFLLHRVQRNFVSPRDGLKCEKEKHVVRCERV